MIMKKIFFGLCIVCFVIELILSFIGRQYMDVVKDIAMILLAMMMFTYLYQKKKLGINSPVFRLWVVTLLQYVPCRR